MGGKLPMRRYGARLDSAVLAARARRARAARTAESSLAPYRREQRLEPDAQYEIRRYAEAVHQLVRADLERIGVTTEMLVKGQV